MRPDWFERGMPLGNLSGYEEVAEHIYRLQPRLYCRTSFVNDENRDDFENGPFVNTLGVGECDQSALHRWHRVLARRELPVLTYPAPLDIPERTYAQWRSVSRKRLEYASYRGDGKLIDKQIATCGVLVCFSGRLRKRDQLPYFVEIH